MVICYIVDFSFLMCASYMYHYNRTNAIKELPVVFISIQIELPRCEQRTLKIAFVTTNANGQGWTNLKVI